MSVLERQVRQPIQWFQLGSHGPEITSQGRRMIPSRIVVQPDPRLFDLHARRAERHLLLFPYLDIIRHEMLDPEIKFRGIAHELEANRRRQERELTSSGAGDTSAKTGKAEKNRSPVADDVIQYAQEYEAEGSLTDGGDREERFEMQYSVHEERGKSIITPVRYGQSFIPLEGIGRLSSGKTTVPEYKITFDEGEISEVETDGISCPSPQYPSTNTFLSRFNGDGERGGSFYLSFHDLKKEPKLVVTRLEADRWGIRRELVSSYSFGNDIDERHTYLQGDRTKDDRLDFSTFVDVLKESVARVPSIML